MNYTLSDLRKKEVIDIDNGIMLGRVDDIEIGENSKANAIIVYGRPKLFGIFGRDKDLIIDFCDISLIGRDTILVSGGLLYENTIDEGVFYKNSSK